MLNRLRRFAVRLHKDESGPNTVEWVLLIIVALLVLSGIYWFVNTYIVTGLQKAGDDLEGQSIDFGP